MQETLIEWALLAPFRDVGTDVGRPNPPKTMLEIRVEWACFAPGKWWRRVFRHIGAFALSHAAGAVSIERDEANRPAHGSRLPAGFDHPLPQRALDVGIYRWGGGPVGYRSSRAIGIVTGRRLFAVLEGYAAQLPLTQTLFRLKQRIGVKNQ
jgi:hypothetical protein